MVRLHRLLTGFVPGIWGLFFCWLLTYGRMYLIRLLHPGLWWLIGCGAMFFLLFSLVVLLSRSDQCLSPSSLSLTGLQAAILLLPLLYFPLASEGRFGGLALEKRSIQPGSMTTQGAYPPPLGPSSQADRDGELTLMDLFRDTAGYEGKTVEISGMAFTDEQLPPDVFLVYRFLMTCCAADAQPVFALVTSKDARSVTKDGWVRIRGTFSMIRKEGVPIPSIQAEQVEAIEEPSIPFLF